jgi:hypothetical protein
MIASKHSCKVSQQQNPLRKVTKKLKQVKKCVLLLGQHKELGQEATSEKYMLSLNT